MLTPEQTKALLSQRSRRSRGRGRGFETRVTERLEKWGYKASKIVLSGARMKKPYDVIVSPHRLKIEAKRRMGESIIIESKWLKKIAPKYIVVFAAGPRLSKNVKMCAISQSQDEVGLAKIEVRGKSKKMWTLDDKFFIRRPKPEGDLVFGLPFSISHDRNKYVVQDFETYMAKHWPASTVKENDNVGA